jgi:uncharacterized membrane protein YkvA (DUF1232 family)
MAGAPLILPRRNLGTRRLFQCLGLPMGVVWVAVAACLAVAVLVVAVSSVLLWQRRQALRNSKMGHLARRVAALPLRRKARLAWRLLADRRVPLLARAVLPAVVLYLAMPLDLIPDFIPVVGYLDDLLVILGAAWLFLRLVPAAVLEEHVAALEAEAGRRDAQL